MISSSIIDLLLNKYVLGSLSVGIALLVAYFKGSSSAQRAAEFERLQKEKALQSRIRAAEAKNQFLEKKGEIKNETIDGSSTIDQLLGLFNEIQSGKSPSSDADKKPK